MDLDGFRALKHSVPAETDADTIPTSTPAGPSGTAVASEQTRGGDDE